MHALQLNGFASIDQDKIKSKEAFLFNITATAHIHKLTLWVQHFATHCAIFTTARLTLFNVIVVGMSRKSRIWNCPWNSETAKATVASRYSASKLLTFGHNFRSANNWKQLCLLLFSCLLQQEHHEGNDICLRKLLLDLLRSLWRYLLFKPTGEENEQLNSAR